MSASVSGKLYLEDGHWCVLMLKHGWWKGFCAAADLLDEPVPVSALVWGKWEGWGGIDGGGGGLSRAARGRITVDLILGSVYTHSLRLCYTPIPLPPWETHYFPPILSCNRILSGFFFCATLSLSPPPSQLIRSITQQSYKERKKAFCKIVLERGWRTQGYFLPASLRNCLAVAGEEPMHKRRDQLPLS